MQGRISTQYGKDYRICHIVEIEFTSCFTFFSGAADVCDVSPRTRVILSVLVSAGTELIFFLVAGTVLCFGFSVRMMLITLRCFSCC